MVLLPGCALIGDLGQFDGAHEVDAGSASESSVDVQADSGGEASRDGMGGGTGDALDGGAADACTATIAMGAVSTPDGYQSAMGVGGYTFPFDDRAGSTSCVATSAMCVAGSTAAADTADWGAALGFNLNQAIGSGATASYAVPSNATGISVLLSNFPPGTRVAIDHGGAEYCAPLPAAASTVGWPQFNTQCWNDQGAYLSGPPNDATYIHVIVPAIGSPRSFDFCIISVDFALGQGGGGYAEGGVDSSLDAAADGDALDGTPDR
jgi:hypothetical protein